MPPLSNVVMLAASGSSNIKNRDRSLVNPLDKIRVKKIDVVYKMKFKKINVVFQKGVGLDKKLSGCKYTLNNSLKSLFFKVRALSIEL